LADELLKSTMADKIPGDLEGMESTLERLLALIDEVYKYVDDVVVRLCAEPHLVISSLCHLSMLTFS